MRASEIKAKDQTSLSEPRIFLGFKLPSRDKVDSEAVLKLPEERRDSVEIDRPAPIERETRTHKENKARKAHTPGESSSEGSPFWGVARDSVRGGQN